MNNAPHAPHRIQVGRFTVTALHDGHFEMPRSCFVNAQGQPAEAGSTATFRLDVNAFLIEAEGRKLLVDTGCGGKLGPTVNQLLPSLRAAGVDPASIDAVLCTHIHPDHTNGLVDAQGVATFANAEVHVHQSELDFWLDEDRMRAAPDGLKAQFAWAREAFAPYADRTRAFHGGEVARGVHALPMFGHTPGHCGYQLDGGGDQQLIIWGDCVHSIGLQAARPDIGFMADVDLAAACATRRRVLEHAAAERVRVTGMHVDFPGFGHIERTATGFHYTSER